MRPTYSSTLQKSLPYATASTAGTPQMMLYGREMHARAQESPEMAAEVRGILPPAAMTTPEEFSARDFAF